MIHCAYISISHRFRLTRHFTGQASECASCRAVTMLRAQIVVHNYPNSLAFRSSFCRCEHSPRKIVLEHRAVCLRDHLVLAIEVGIKTAMSQTQMSHQRSNSRSLDPIAPELLSSFLQKSVMGLIFVLARVAHIVMRYMMAII